MDVAAPVSTTITQTVALILFVQRLCGWLGPATSTTVRLAIQATAATIGLVRSSVAAARATCTSIPVTCTRRATATGATVTLFAV